MTKGSGILSLTLLTVWFTNPQISLHIKIFVFLSILNYVVHGAEVSWLWLYFTTQLYKSTFKQLNPQKKTGYEPKFLSEMNRSLEYICVYTWSVSLQMNVGNCAHLIPQIWVYKFVYFAPSWHCQCIL